MRHLLESGQGICFHKTVKLRCLLPFLSRFSRLFILRQRFGYQIRVLSDIQFVRLLALVNFTFFIRKLPSSDKNVFTRIICKDSIQANNILYYFLKLLVLKLLSLKSGRSYFSTKAILIKLSFLIYTFRRPQGALFYSRSCTQYAVYIMPVVTGSSPGLNALNYLSP